MILTILFWIAVGALFYTYVLYPLLLKILAKGKSLNPIRFTDNDPLPSVSILLAFRNESNVLVKKLTSLAQVNYPVSKIEILLGSDASDDDSDMTARLWSQKHDHFVFKRYDQRVGKVQIINDLASTARGEILVITDANVFSETDSLRSMVQHFKNTRIGLVDSNMKHLGLRKNGISLQEHTYISREMIIKYNESRIWGTMMGPSGGFYAVRSQWFTPVPGNFLVDDFYINLKVLTSGHKSIQEPAAIVHEDISNALPEEFRRKVRIAAGNFQNLSRFARLLLKPFSAVGFCFVSHKVIRWFGPFFLLVALLSNVFLISSPFYQVTLLVQIMLLSIPFIDLILRKINVHIVILRFVTHFYTMNLALLAGFVWFLKGIRSNVWEPTRRNQP